MVNNMNANFDFKEVLEGTGSLLMGYQANNFCDRRTCGTFYRGDVAICPVTVGGLLCLTYSRRGLENNPSVLPFVNFARKEEL